MKAVIVMPAYNAAKTIERTYSDIPKEYRKHIILTDDKSSDETAEIARKLKIKVIKHNHNRGYGGNQKTCYREALNMKADIVVMLHPDYQYPPELITPMIEMIKTGRYDCILGSRILAGEALRGGMPLYKYLANRFLTFAENVMTGAKLSEYHTGFRAYKGSVLSSVQFRKNSDDFIFDNQILLQILGKGYRIGEISSPCRYFVDMSSINLFRSIKYGFGCLYWGLVYLLGRLGLYRHPLIYTI